MLFMLSLCGVILHVKCCRYLAFKDQCNEVRLGATVRIVMQEVLLLLLAENFKKYKQGRMVKKATLMNFKLKLQPIIDASFLAVLFYSSAFQVLLHCSSGVLY
jgi:hypothetical protein